MKSTPSDAAALGHLQRLMAGFDEALAKLESAKPFAKPNYAGRFLDQARRLLAVSGGASHAYASASRFERAGVFAGSDWEFPGRLNANLVPFTFQSDDPHLIALECLSELRFLAVATGQYLHPTISQEQASHFLTKVLALHLHRLFGAGSEADRAGSSAQRSIVLHLEFIAEHVGFEDILEEVVNEVWRILRQRPVKVDFVKIMVTRVAECLHDPALEVKAGARGAEMLISALYGPTQASREDPGIYVYLERVAAMHAQTLSEEVQAFARAMHDTGLVSPYHAALVRELVTLDPDLLPLALGLSSTGRDAFYCYRDLVLTLIDMCVFHDTSQAVLGLSWLLERGILYQPGVPASLWRQTTSPLAPEVRDLLRQVCGDAHSPHVYLLVGIINVLGQPLGLGQGNNPVCQSTRAISMWSYSDPDYLLQLTRWAARDNSIAMMFEGQSLLSSAIPGSRAGNAYLDLDPLSLILVPHLDRIYEEMARLCAGRDEDYHKWINPEFHGWRVSRGFAIAVDVHTRRPKDLQDFVTLFYSLYHPYHNNNTPVVHPQPAGIAFTDGSARYVGWHAITILRIALDHQDVMRVYFFNPNNDSGQDWGRGVVVSTHGHGERPGESSLPFDQFASRLYLFHYDPSDYYGPAPSLSPTEIDAVVAMAQETWVPGLVQAAG